MLFERIESKGLAHYSYIIGDKSHAVVIDPRRDCDIYIERAQENGMRITHILETHRHEDFVVGSAQLAKKTGAEVFHSNDDSGYMYGKTANDGQTIAIGRYSLKVLDTPGHTPASLSYILYDPDKNPWIAFTGDTLFSGDVGRVDLAGKELINSLANALYDSIFSKLLPLGDDVIVCPAHGAGSVCGETIADRPITTIGHERMHNPKLQLTGKKEFIKAVSGEHEKPPYMTMMERLNVEGPENGLPVVAPLSAKEFDSVRDRSIIIDTRMELGYGAAHIHRSLSIWGGGLASFAGWFLPYDYPILLVTESNNPSEDIATLYRLGYDNIKGYLSGSMLAWHMSGKKSSSIPTLTVQSLCGLIDSDESLQIVDVRSEEEIRSSMEIPDAIQIPITQLKNRMNEIPMDKVTYIFCGSGMRSMMGASILRNAGYENVRVVLGGLSGWSSISCPLK